MARELLSRVEWKNVALLAVAVVLLAIYAKLFAVVLLIAAVVLVSVVIQQIPPLRLVGIELVTFATVIAGVTYGPVIGFALGAVLVLFHLVFSGYVGVYYAWVVPIYGLGGYMASQWADQNIASLGLNITLLIHAANMALTFVFNRGNILNYGIYAATNIIFNFLIFLLFGGAVLGILG